MTTQDKAEITFLEMDEDFARFRRWKIAMAYRDLKRARENRHRREYAAWCINLAGMARRSIYA